jgi:hypothetical protein
MNGWIDMEKFLIGLRQFSLVCVIRKIRRRRHGSKYCIQYNNNVEIADSVLQYRYDGYLVQITNK